MRIAALTLLVCILCSTISAIPANDKKEQLGSADIRNALLQQVPQCATVAENAARLILNSDATTETVESEWENLCGSTQNFRLYRLAQAIDRIHKDSPELNAELWATLKNGSNTTGNQLGQLLVKVAQQSHPMSDDGKALRIWFIEGFARFQSKLEQLPNSKLYSFLALDRENFDSGFSLSMAATGGAWVPNGNLSILGNHPSLGMQMLLGINRVYFGTTLDFRFLNTPQTYAFFNPNSNQVERTNTFFSMLLGFEARYEFFRTARFSIFAIGGLGYDFINQLQTSRYSNQRAVISDSFNMNFGLAIRAYLTDDKLYYFDLDARYHTVNYQAAYSGGDDLSGKYWSLLFAIGIKLNFDN